MICIMHECVDCKKYNESMLISYIWQLHGGRGRAGTGRRGETVINAGACFYINIGGRGRAGAGRREKTGVM